MSAIGGDRVIPLTTSTGGYEELAFPDRSTATTE
jgi:hypothetical protein